MRPALAVGDNAYLTAEIAFSRGKRRTNLDARQRDRVATRILQLNRRLRAEGHSASRVW
jgi:hypothetical protein